MLGLVLLTSCSNDTQEPTVQNTSVIANSADQDELNLKGTIDPVLKQLYIDMISSQSYIDYDNARSAFYEKLGGNIPVSEMDAGNKMLAWIQNNLTQTGFLSYQEALDKHEDVVALGIEAIEANLTFHEHLAGAATDALVPILDELEPLPANCKACIKAYKNCVGIANRQYGEAMQQASHSFTEGGSSYLGNYLQYQRTTDTIYYNRARAISSCETNFEICCAAS